MDKVVLEKEIYYYKNVFNNSSLFMKNIHESNLNWRDWYSSDGSIIYGKVAGGINVLPEEILTTLKSAVFNSLYDYCLNNNKDLGFVPEFYTIQKYNVGAYMGPHVDSTDKTISKFPTISMVVYLNDDYEGGEIEFPKQDISLKPEAGSIIIFPSYDPYTHDPKPVISGDKYMSPVFCFKEAF